MVIDFFLREHPHRGVSTQMFPEKASRDPRCICCRSVDVYFSEVYTRCKQTGLSDVAGVSGAGGCYIFSRQMMDFKYCTEEETNCISAENIYFSWDLGFL